MMVSFCLSKSCHCNYMTGRHIVLFEHTGASELLALQANYCMEAVIYLRSKLHACFQCYADS